MGIWPELHTCILSTKSKSVKENETRFNTLQNQFTFKLQKTNKETKTKQKTFNLIYLIWKRNIKETRLSRTNDMLLSIFHFSRFHGISLLNQLVSARHLLFLLMCDFIFLKGNINNPGYGLLAWFAFQRRVWSFIEVFGVNPQPHSLCASP